MKIDAIKNIFEKVIPLRVNDIDGMRKLGQPVLDFINSKKNHEMFKNNLDNVTFDFNQRKYEADKIINCFDEQGIVVLKNFLNKDLINEINIQISDLNLEDAAEKYLVSKSSNEFKRLRKKNPSSFLINIRNAGDKGMIDLFNLDKVLSENINNKVYELLSDELLKDLLAMKLNKEQKSISLNAYLNKGIKNTRGFHVDAFYPVIKVMTYLTDVNCLSDGPYCYVCKSHNEKSLIQENKKISYLYTGEYTDTPLINISHITPILGEAGTMIFSDQAGHHRGLPQGANNKRAVLVAKYFN